MSPKPIETIKRVTRKQLVAKALRGAKRDDYSGYCIYCGSHRGNCEPDAERYPCESCGWDKVYGAEQILLRWG